MVLEAIVLALCAAAEPAPARKADAPAPPLKADVPLPPPPVDTRAFRPAPPLKAKGPAGRIVRVGVPEPNVVGDVSAREVAVVSQALVTEVRKVDGVGAIGVGEIREMLSQEYRRQMLGCSADQQCLAEIAGALGVDELVSSQIVVEGGTATLTASRIDMRSTRVIGSVQKRLARRNAGEEVLGALGEVVATLYPDRPLREGQTRGVAKQVARWLNPPPVPPWAFYSTAAAAVVAVGGGAVYGLAANSTRSDYNALARSGGTVSGAELSRLKEQASSQSTRATILFGIGGGLAVAAAVEAVFTDWHNDRAAVLVGPAGAAVNVKF